MKIVYQSKNQDGSLRLHVVHSAKKEDIEKILGLMTDEEFKKHVWERSVPADAIDPLEIDEDSIPKDREFRDAWSHDGKCFGHNLSAAKDIALRRIRECRLVLLRRYDDLLNRALDLQLNDEAMAIRKKRQELRDCTNALKAMDATCIDDIKMCIPDFSKYEEELNTIN